MRYRIIEKPTGVKKTTPIVEIESPTIRDFCYIDGLGILFVYDQCIGLIPPEGNPVVPWRGEEGIKRQEFYESHFDDPCALAYNPFTRQLYVLEKCGIKIRVLENLSVGSNLLKGEDEKVMGVLFSKVVPSGDAKIAFRSPYGIIWTAPDIHRCLAYSDSRVSILIGDGRGRYSVSNSLAECSLNSPSDIMTFNNDVFVADFENFCIRRISSKGVSLFCGNPSRKDVQPRRMTLQDNIIYVLDGNSIKSFPISNKNGMIVYESENIIDLTEGKNGLLILEVVK